MKKIYFLITAGVVYLAGQYFRGFWWPHFTWPFHCFEVTYGTTSYCDPAYLDTLGWPLIATGEVLAIVGIILLFANADGFRAWWRFSRWSLPIAAFVVIFLSPIVLFHSLMLSSSISRERTVYDFGAIYILVTLILVVWKWITSHHVNSVKF